MSVIEERLPYIEPLVLGRGAHPAPNNGLVHACVMEAVAYVAGEPFTDHPACASPVLGSVSVPVCDEYPTAQAAFDAQLGFARSMAAAYPPPSTSGATT